MPTVSIVLPVLDGARTLPACLDAVTAGAPAGAEIIVVDDGSTDATAEIGARYGRVVSHGVNRGTSAARNTGWREARGDVVVFVDADVVVRPDAIPRLLAALEATPDALGANGALAARGGTGAAGWYANVSIHYQHLLHGDRVASAFTSLCALRRSTLVEMGGWEDRWHGRYADDVVTRFHLPPGSLLVDHAAQGDHHKKVPALGLLRHRFWIGWFYVRSLVAHRGEVAHHPGTAVLSMRYPVNTLLAACLPLLAFAPLPTLPIAALALTAAGLANNAGFLAFVTRTYGVGHALAAIPLVTAESVAMLVGLGASVGTLPFADRPAPARDPQRAK